MASLFTVPLSITETWIVTGRFEISHSDAGKLFHVELPLAFSGSTREGWMNPLFLYLYPPSGEKLPPQVVYPQSIPLNGKFENFPFPPFTTRGSGDVNLYVFTEQNGNLPSALLIGDAIIKERPKTSIPLSIKWEWTVSGVVKPNDLKEGSKYEIDFPLTLNGDTHDGWDAPLFLRIKQSWLPVHNQLAPELVDPKSIPLHEEYKEFSFGPFDAIKAPEDGTIKIKVSTIQEAKLRRPLLIGGQGASPLLIDGQEAIVKKV